MYCDYSCHDNLRWSAPKRRQDLAWNTSHTCTTQLVYMYLTSHRMSAHTNRSWHATHPFPCCLPLIHGGSYWLLKSTALLFVNGLKFRACASSSLNHLVTEIPKNNTHTCTCTNQFKFCWFSITMHLIASLFLANSPVFCFRLISAAISLLTFSLSLQKHKSMRQCSHSKASRLSWSDHLLILILL